MFGYMYVPESAWRVRMLGDMNGVNMGLCYGMSLSIVQNSGYVGDID